MQKVVDNFLLGLTRLKIEYTLNQLPVFYKPSDKVICFGLGRLGLAGIRKTNPLIAAIGFPYPGELPELSDRYNLRKFLQHSEWVLDLSRTSGAYPSQVYETWPAGIDTKEWTESARMENKKIDVLIYNKIYWEPAKYNRILIEPIKHYLKENNYSYNEIFYGQYVPGEYKMLLNSCRIMIFLSAHESQGLAYQEALSSGVPVFAWNPGFWLDPKRFEYGLPEVRASSVPFFDARCGMEFKDAKEFSDKFELFIGSAHERNFSPREYILDNLSIEKSTEKMLSIYNSI